MVSKSLFLFWCLTAAFHRPHEDNVIWSCDLIVNERTNPRLMAAPFILA
jgi:hypothetical protein